MPRKKTHKAADVCKMVDIQPYVLRYWETEFPFLRAEAREGGARGYTEAEVELVRRVRGLLYEEGYTIAGAKKKLEGGGDDGAVEQRSAVAAPPVVSSPAPVEAEVEPRQEASASAAAQVKLRRGVEEALQKARALLDQLQPG